MTETQEPPTAAEQQSTTTGPTPPGVDRQHLRSYELLRRSLTDRKVAGVAGGLGRHLNIDPTVVRVLLVVMCFFGGAGFVLYGVAWLLVPEDGQVEGKIATSPSTRNVLLIGGGVLAALLLVGDGWGGIGFPWPLFLVGVGVLIYVVLRKDDPAHPRSGTPRRVRTGPRLFGSTLALMAVALGALGLYDASGGAVVDSAYPALALTVVGLMLVLGAFVGRAGGLILLGLVCAFALAVTSVVGGFRGMDFNNGERISVAPTSADGVQDSYDLASGRALVDLSDVRDPDSLDGRTIDVRGRAGELVVVLPDGVESDVTAVIDGPGQIDLPDHSSGGIDSDLTGTYGSGRSTVTINTHLSAGHIDVRKP